MLISGCVVKTHVNFWLINGIYFLWVFYDRERGRPNVRARCGLCLWPYITSVQRKRKKKCIRHVRRLTNSSWVKKGKIFSMPRAKYIFFISFLKKKTPLPPSPRLRINVLLFLITVVNVWNDYTADWR